MFTVCLRPCGTNCFLIKKKPVWMIKKVSACLHLLGVSNPSTAPVWGSACSSNCGRSGRDFFVQSCSTPSGGKTEEMLHFSKSWRRQVLIGWAWGVLFCIASRCFCVLCFYISNDVFVLMSDDGCVHLTPQSVCIWLLLCLKQCAWSINVCGKCMLTEEVLCDSKGHTTERWVRHKQFRAKQTLDTGCPYCSG